MRNHLEGGEHEEG